MARGRHPDTWDYERDIQAPSRKGTGGCSGKEGDVCGVWGPIQAKPDLQHGGAHWIGRNHHQ